MLTVDQHQRPAVVRAQQGRKSEMSNSDSQSSPSDDTPDHEEIDEQAVWDEMVKADDAGDATADPEDDDPAPDFPADDDTKALDATDDDPAPADAGKGDEPASDIWANASPEARKAYDDMKSDRDRTNDGWSRDKSRVSSMTKQLETFRKPTPPAGNDQPTDGNAEDDALSQLEEEYPEIAKPLLTKINALAESTATLTAAETQRQNDALQKQESSFLEDHPDGFEVVEKDVSAFQSWVEDQPKAMRDKAFANSDSIVNGKDAATVVASYKSFLADSADPIPADPDTTPESQSKTDLKAKRQRQLDGLKSPSSKGPAALMTGIDENASDQDQWDAMVKADDRKRAAGQR